MKTIVKILLAAIILISCNTSDSNKTEKKGDFNLTGAGATFPLPFYNMIFKEYGKKYGTEITYGGIGSGGGIRSLKDNIVDFGATDAFIEDSALSEMPSEVIHIPTCLGAVAIAYNLKEIESLKLSESLLEKIFLGEIENWNDPDIQKLNDGIELPDKKITVVYRSDGSGTTYIFSDYMSKTSNKWQNSLGRGKSLNWPTGISAKGNPGVAGTIVATEGAIGYIGSEYALSMNISTANIKNSSGNYIKPSVKSISASAETDLPADMRVMLTNSENPEAYPISGFTWIILYKDQDYGNRKEINAIETVKLLNWIISEEAQSQASKVHYAPLPDDAVKKAKELISSVRYKGKVLTEK